MKCKEEQGAVAQGGETPQEQPNRLPYLFFDVILPFLRSVFGLGPERLGENPKSLGQIRHVSPAIS